MTDATFDKATDIKSQITKFELWYLYVTKGKKPKMRNDEQKPFIGSITIYYGNGEYDYLTRREIPIDLSEKILSVIADDIKDKIEKLKKEFAKL